MSKRCFEKIRTVFELQTSDHPEDVSFSSVGGQFDWPISVCQRGEAHYLRPDIRYEISGKQKVSTDLFDTQR